MACEIDGEMVNRDPRTSRNHARYPRYPQGLAPESCLARLGIDDSIMTSRTRRPAEKSEDCSRTWSSNLRLGRKVTGVVSRWDVGPPLSRLQRASVTIGRRITGMPDMAASLRANGHEIAAESRWWRPSNGKAGRNRGDRRKADVLRHGGFVRPPVAGAAETLRRIAPGPDDRTGKQGRPSGRSCGPERHSRTLSGGRG
jgi:hypothetical protein